MIKDYTQLNFINVCSFCNKRSRKVSDRIYLFLQKPRQGGPQEPDTITIQRVCNNGINAGANNLYGCIMNIILVILEQYTMSICATNFFRNGDSMNYAVIILL